MLQAFFAGRRPCMRRREPSYNCCMYICLFDIDGTLLSSGGAGQAAMEAALGPEFGIGPVTDGVPFSGRTDRGIARDLVGRHGIQDRPENRQRFLPPYLRPL